MSHRWKEGKIERDKEIIKKAIKRIAIERGFKDFQITGEIDYIHKIHYAVDVEIEKKEAKK